MLKILVAVMLYGTAVEPRFVVRHDEAAPIPHLPPEWEGKQVAVFADLQVGMWWANTDAARRLVRTVVHIRPAAVLIAGDFVYNADDNVDAQMQKVIAILRPMLDDSIPVYAVLGNHDYSLMNEHSNQENYVARAVRTELLHAGVHMMDNTAAALPSPRGDSLAPQPLYLAGIGEKWAKNDRVAATLAMIPNDAPRLIFMHDPDSFALIPAGQAPVAIAAHTHGMQLGIPFLSDYLWRNYFSDAGSGVEGWISDFGQAGNRLYINRGVGFSIVPARVNAVPELTVFTLTRAQ
ncbi:MAG TPA: metallophosphoesterase [Gemmatimonadaceae bacterium]